MHAWCLTLAKQTCQTLPSLRKAATQQLVRGVADGKHPPQAWLSSSHAAASLYSQVKPEHAWHGKIAAQLRRYSQQATTSTLGIKRMPKQSSITVKQPPHLSQKAIHIRHAHFRSLHCPASGLAQSIMTLQKKPLPMLLQWPGPKQLARISTTSSKGSSIAKQALEALDPAVVSKAHKLSVPVGLLAGVFGSFVGVGGGVLIVPLLTGACKGLPQRLVSGTSLVAVVSTALASSYTYLSHGVVDTGAALLLSCCAVVTAPLGANLTTTLNPAALKKALGYFLVLVAFLVPLKSVLFHNRQPVSHTTSDPLDPSPSVTDQPATTTAAAATAEPAAVTLSSLTQSAKASWSAMSWPTAFMLGGTGAAAGVASGLLGIGGGTIVTPLLAMLTPLTQAGVLGTSLLAMVAPSCVGLTQHARLGNVDWRMAAGLAAGTAVGSAAGSKVAVNAPAGILEGIFSVGMLFLGWRTLSGARKAVQKVATMPQKS